MSEFYGAHMHFCALGANCAPCGADPGRPQRRLAPWQARNIALGSAQQLVRQATGVKTCVRATERGRRCAFAEAIVTNSGSEKDKCWETCLKMETIRGFASRKLQQRVGPLWK